LKDAYYFPHDANARRDIKILQLRSTEKLAGYGFYFMVLEILREQKDFSIPSDAQPTLELELGIPKEEISRLMELCFSLDLLQQEGGKIFSRRLNERMGGINKRREFFRRIGKKGGQATLKRVLELRSTHAQPVKESKGKERKEKEKIPPLVAESGLQPADSSPKEKPPHVQFCDRFKEAYESMTGQPYKHKREHFVIAARLIKNYGFDLVVQKVKILGAFCRDRSLWFTKGGWADFSIEKLSGHWNAIIPEAKFDKRDEQEEEKLRRKKLNELTDNLLNQ